MPNFEIPAGVLTEIKSDENLMRIPMLLFTVSNSEMDKLEAYNIQASAIIIETLGLDEFTAAVEWLEEFWLTIIKLPKDASSETNV